jgi:hypothetical protein
LGGLVPRQRTPIGVRGNFLFTVSRNLKLLNGRYHLPCPPFSSKNGEIYKQFSKFIKKTFLHAVFDFLL